MSKSYVQGSGNTEPREITLPRLCDILRNINSNIVTEINILECPECKYSSVALGTSVYVLEYSASVVSQVIAEVFLNE